MYNPLLESFICVADCGSFNRASEKLFISAPSIMKQINTLENHLQLTLFHRNNQGIQLTSSGQIIYKYAKRLIEQSNEILKEAKNVESIKSKTFKIGSSLLNPCKPFMDLWYQVSQQFTGYNLQIVPFEDTHENIVSEIHQLGKKYDFMMGVCDSALWLKYCNFLQLGTYQHQIALSRNHPLAKKKKLKIEDLFGQTIMMVKKGDSKCVDSIRKKIEKYPQIQIEDTSQFYDIEVFNHCAQSNQIMLTIECWKDVHPALVTLPMDWNFPIPYGILYAKNPNKEVLSCIQSIQNLTT